MINDKKLKKIIKDSLGMTKNDDVIEEALVAQENVFNLKTELLSASTKDSHLELYEGYLKQFNIISAQLDNVNRSESNSTHSAYRSLKCDETYAMNAVYLHSYIQLIQ